MDMWIPHVHSVILRDEYGNDEEVMVEAELG